MKDCFGITYEVERMPGNGLCGYSALAYTLTGDERQYALVIEDLLKAFYGNPQIFTQQTEYARLNPNLSKYHKEVLQAVANVRKQSVGRLYFEYTLSITHCLRLNLQLHTIALVRTCRISSFCTVAWQLARFQLTRRIARSLGDS